MITTLHFDMTIEVNDDSSIDDLGEGLALDLLMQMMNGEDVLEIEYKGHDLR